MDAGYAATGGIAGLIMALVLVVFVLLAFLIPFIVLLTPTNRARPTGYAASESDDLRE
jgi:hypothetical protein